MRRAASLLIAALAAVGSAAPYTAPSERRWQWPSAPSLPQSLRRWPFTSASEDCGKHPSPTLTHQKKSYLHLEEKAISSGACDLQSAVNYMNLTAVTPALAPPEPGLTLFQVAIGRGTQNYTCDLSNATAVPILAGALATLYNFSCVAAQQPALLQQLPQIALNMPIPTLNNTHAHVLERMESGHHYFLNSTTPFFNLDTATHRFGMGAMSKANASDAPAGAPVGENGQGFGATTWLRLVQNPSGPEDHWKEVYRLNTAGGDAPKTCVGQQAAFEIPYAAEYWLFV